MKEKIPALLNSIIAIALLTASLVIMKKKVKEDPSMKVSGLSLTTAIKLCYAGIAIFILLFVYDLLK